MGCCVSSSVAGEEYREAEVQQDEKLSKRDISRAESLTAEGKADALLALIPSRLFTNGTSDGVCLFTQQGRKGTNQDAMVVWEDFGSMEDTVFCGVFDGHGPYGHLVARRVRDSMPSKILHYWQEDQAQRDDGEHNTTGETLNSQELRNPHEYGEHEYQEEDAQISGSQNHEDAVAKEDTMFGLWRESHLAAYRVMDKELRSHPGIDCFCSGTTAVTVLKQGKHLVIGNVGDSRAIIGTKDRNGAYVAVQLTIDLKPDLPSMDPLDGCVEEAERIQQCRGRVFALHDEPEVPRVWLPFDDTPGLAMARAFGDFCLKDYGVIAVPEMTYRELRKQDQFIVLATDGIWDVLSNDEVVELIAQAPSRATAARGLVESAVRVWRLKYPTSKVDDCAAVILYLDHPSHPRSKSKKSSSSGPKSDQYSLNLQYQGSRSSKTKAAGANSSLLQAATAGLNGSFRQDPQSSSWRESAGEGKATKLPRKLADWLGADVEEEEEWSALQGVTRVNSLLNLPRFQATDRRANGGLTSQQRPAPEPFTQSLQFIQ